MAIDIDHILFLHFLAQDEVGVCKSRKIEQKAHLAHSCSQSECRIRFIIIALGTVRDIITTVITLK